MTEPSAPITEDDLHAFLDGALDQDRVTDVERYLADNPDVAREIENWRQRETDLRGILDAYRFGGDVEIPVPEPRVVAGRRMNWTAMAAAVVIAFGFGGGAGYFGRSLVETPSAVRDLNALWLDAAARDVFLTYVGEVRHPVEVGADEQEHLTNWLGNRIERPFTAPSLDDLGFGLVGGRLLPVNGRPGAMLMYENGQGDRATILLARNAGARDTAFQFSQGEGVNTFRWIDGPLAYAITGFLDRGALQDITHAVYDHFEAI